MTGQMWSLWRRVRFFSPHKSISIRIFFSTWFKLWPKPIEFKRRKLNIHAKWIRKYCILNIDAQGFLMMMSLQKNDEFSVAIAVRLHKTLELAGDKFYMITCGKAGFQNTRWVLSLDFCTPFHQNPNLTFWKTLIKIFAFWKTIFE